MAIDLPASTPNWLLDPRRRWDNYHQNFVKKIEGVFLLNNAAGQAAFAAYNATTAAIQRVLGAAAAGGHTLRGLGSGWSLSEIAVCDGYLANNKDLKIWFPFRHQAQLDPQFQGDASNVFCFQAGMTIKAISRELEGAGKSLPTSGASDGQTIAGALSTGTHGAALQFGAVPEFVVALHLATASDRTVWLERASRPVIAPTLAQQFGAQLVRDDALFDAALVGLGAFGMLLSVTIEAEPLYLLEAYAKLVPRDAALAAAMDAQDFGGLQAGVPGERPWHFSLIVNPHAPEHAYVTLLYKRPFRTDYPRHDFTDPDGSLGDDALEFIGRAIDALPLLAGAAIPRIVTTILQDRYQVIDKKFGTHREVFPATSTRGKVSSTAVAIDASHASAVLDAVLAMHGGGEPFPGAFGVRFVKGTRATLGFTRFPHTCVIEADGAVCARTTAFNRRFWKAFADLGREHTMHWGKINNLTKHRVRRMWGNERVDAWRAARAALLSPALRSAFSNATLERAGLTD